MPCFNFSTNVNVDGLETSDFFSEDTKVVASTIEKSKNERILSHSYDYYIIVIVMINWRGGFKI